MATPRRGRQSTAPRRPTQGPTPLPAYQPPSCPLNDAAQRSLLALSQTRDVNRLKDHIRRGHETLQDSATEINERLQSKLAQQERADARRAESGREEDAESRALVEEMKQKVEELTRNMEAGVRTMIDAQATIEAVEKALGEVHHAIVDGGGAAHPTQSTLGASQHRSQNRRRPANSEDEGNGEEENEESIQPVVGPLDLLKRKMAEHEAQYGQLALRARYAQHNDYVSFKKTVHDAMHPGEDAPPLPHASTWFPDPNSQPSSGANGNEDEGSDIEVASERISIKCPLTLLPMVDPVTSKKCPHSFERNAIMEMISQSTVRIGGGRSGEKMMKCPVCEVVLTGPDLSPNPYLARKIKRIQAAQAAAEEEAEDSDESNPVMGTQRGGQRRHPQAEDIDSESGNDIDDYEAGGKKRRSGAAGAAAAAVKRERARTASRIPDSQGMGGRGRGEVVELDDD